ncbi:MAG: DUF1501 domain-containing protein [Bryobacteraceae bacterium]
MKDRFGFQLTPGGPGFWQRPAYSRRVLFRHASTALAGCFHLPLAAPILRGETVTRAAVAARNTARQCIFVLLEGGPSQIDTFDLKEGAWTPKELQPTEFNGVKWPRGILPKLGDQLGSLAIVRSGRAWAAVHVLAQVWAQIGRNPTAATSRIAPHIGSVVSLEKTTAESTLPGFVSMNASSGIGNGWLAPAHAPFFTTPGGGGLTNSRHSLGADRFGRRYDLLLQLDADLRERDSLGAAPYQTQAFNLAARQLIYNDKIDDIFTFTADERARYGSTTFGNCCIAARNMLRARSGVRFIQIRQGGWDNHENIWQPNAGHFARARELDNGLGTLLADLGADGLLDETIVVAMGEFGRTTGNLNPQKGRDHLLQHSFLVAGAGVRGGRAIGSTNAAGSATLDPGWSRQRDVRPEDVEATIYSALGIDWTTVRRDDPTGRGFEYVPDAQKDKYGPIHELWD